MAQQKSKKSSTPWVQCEKCTSNVLYKDMERHSGDCPPNLKETTYGFIKDNTLYGNLDVKTNEDIKGVADKDTLVFLSQGAIQLCSLAIGEWAVIKLNSLPLLAKKVWPTNEKTLTSVLFTKNALELCKGLINTSVTVSALPPGQPEAYRVNVVILNASKSFELLPELNNRIRKDNVDKFFSVGNVFGTMYFGKVLKFEIKAIETQPSIGLEGNFKNLTISEDAIFYKITDKTAWRLFSDETEFKRETSDRDPFSEIGGLDEEIAEIREAINLCLSKSTKCYGLRQSKSILLHGNPGTGKTHLARALARETRAHVINISASDLYSKYSEDVDATLRHLFEEAVQHSPSVIILDEVDLLCPHRTQQRSTDAEKRVVATLLTQLDDLSYIPHVFVLAITSKLDSIDPAFRRHGRFDRELEISTPSPKTRLAIMAKLLSNVVHDLSQEDLNEVALNTHGFVGADLLSLCSRAGLNAARRQAEALGIEDFKTALKHVRPSAMREVQVEVANVRWADIGGQHHLKQALKQAVEWPLRHPQSFTRLGVTPPRGVLMFGPPGCSKTMIAKALATESGLNFLSIKGPELFSKWVGESERAVREVFRKARQVAPSVVFFDEIDALGGERGSSSSVQERVLAQLLTELDGVSPLGDVTVLAATNRPDRIDKALLRPGRLDRIVYVPLPDRETRREIFKLKMAKMPVKDVDVEELVDLTERYSGAEINAVCHEAAMSALEESLEAEVVERRHFDKALKLIGPRTPVALIDLYKDYLNKKL